MPTAIRPVQEFTTIDVHRAYRKHLGERAKVAMYEKVLAGLPSGRIPLGYRRTADGTIELDPPIASQIEEAFILVATQEKSLRETLTILTQMGLRTKNDRRLHLSTLHSILFNPFYAGMIRYGGRIHPGKHQAIVSQKLFREVSTKLKR